MSEGARSGPWQHFDDKIAHPSLSHSFILLDTDDKEVTCPKGRPQTLPQNPQRQFRKEKQGSKLALIWSHPFKHFLTSPFLFYMYLSPTFQLITQSSFLPATCLTVNVKCCLSPAACQSWHSQDPDSHFLAVVGNHPLPTLPGWVKFQMPDP